MTGMSVRELFERAGSQLQLKPIITMNAGKAGLERVRTRKKAEERLLQMVEDLGPLEQLGIRLSEVQKAKDDFDPEQLNKIVD